MKQLLLFLLCALIFLMPNGRLPAQAETTLTLWALNGPNDQGDENAYLRALVAGFMKENTDVKIEWAGYGVEGAEATARINEALDNGSGPDIFQTGGRAGIEKAAGRGLLLDLTLELSDLPANRAVQAVMGRDGKLYGVIPFFSATGMFVNEGKLKSLKLAIPQTVDELEQAARAIKAAGLQPFACGLSDRWPIVFTYAYLVLEADGNAFERAVKKRTLRFDAEPFVRAALRLQGWSKNGWFGPKPQAENYAAAIDLMSTGKAVLQVTGSWLTRSYASPAMTEQTMGFYPFPAARSVVGGTEVGFAAAASAAPKKEAIVRFFRYAMSSMACEADQVRRTCAVKGVKAPDRLTGMTDDVLGRAERIVFFPDQEMPAALVEPFFDLLKSLLNPAVDVKKQLSRFEESYALEAGPVK
jgi:raffinose/stachyose/melibiose transport system substrate-binding protein